MEQDFKVLFPPGLKGRGGFPFFLNTERVLLLAMHCKALRRSEGTKCYCAGQGSIRMYKSVRDLRSVTIPNTVTG